MFLIYIQDTSFVLNKCNKPKVNIRMVSGCSVDGL